jgi:hypothetical protein
MGRLERAQGSPELGHGRAAIAQQRLERARALAVAKEREPEAAAQITALLEQLDFDPVRPREPPRGDCDAAREPPRGDCDAAREHGLQRAAGRQLLDQRGLERGELRRVLVRQHEMLLCAQAVLQHSAPSAPCLRASSARATSRRCSDWAAARALLTLTAARGDCPVGSGGGAPTPLGSGNPALDMVGFLGWKGWPGG